MTFPLQPFCRGLGAALEAAEAVSPVDAVDAITEQLSATLGTERVSFLIADLAGRTLVRLSHGAEIGVVGDRRDGAELARSVPFTFGSVEQTLREQRTTVEQVGAAWRVLAPVSQRGEVIGLLEVFATSTPDEDVVSVIAMAARTLAYVVIANRRHTDLFEWGQRSVPFELSAELQRRLLPAAFTCDDVNFTLSAWLEPAATIGGDTYDYTLSRDTLHLSVTDAMGHGVDAAVTASIAVGALRNSRRRGADLVDQVAAANVAVHGYRVDGFCTGLIGQVDLATGVLTVVNAGHVPPVLMRAGRAHELSPTVDLPMGIRTDTGYRTTEIPLEAGDRLVVVTDGMVERSAEDVDLMALIEQTSALHAREATRRLADVVIAASVAGLTDDATVLVLDWHPEAPGRG